MPSDAFPATPDALLWRGIASAIEQAITSGSLPVGSRLPGEHELAGSFGASRHTVVRAVRHLAAQGLVQRRQGIGTFVTTAQRMPPTTTVRIHATEALALLPDVPSGPSVQVTAVAHGATVGQFQVTLHPASWKTPDELADIDVLGGNRGWEGCRRRTRVDLDPATTGTTLMLRIRTDIADLFTGRTCSIVAQLSPSVFSVESAEPLQEQRTTGSDKEQNWH
ncbi:GntR family transcriptional regulator [Curtobacterium flaccumfaciens]|uniref:GntR family transcriptional regulator n=1 Tax=Curtobacterium poinsettiae TaxID=159612 RepID=A0A9Q9PAD9_9MICO|nr:GntR family transcriptional regulator [Curtobacterium flaccumfaciens]UXN23949.1 GntR family transcriptional regulator [Curtobacterium flaccumfaciens]UYC82064.1 GntR family transcriptional regulator [Curtobacterium flaccumfaciens pv. poinsettiae]